MCRWLIIVSMILTLLPVILSQSNTSVSVCPSNCNCYNNGTIGCLQCLRGYFRTYSLKNNVCPCRKGFVEMQIPSRHCCPANCSICTGDGGCASCHRNWTLQLTDVGIAICVCKSNYFYDGYDCCCLDKIRPAAYYWVQPQNTCYFCPEGCICDQNGCISCVSTNRVIKRVRVNSTHTVYGCRCLPPLQSNGVTCICPFNCTCILGTIICNNYTNRFLTAHGIWECQPPYTQVNFACVCLAPYQLINVFSEGMQCICGSVLSLTTIYYNNEQECVVCPKDCVCNEIGCISCSYFTNRQIIGNSCPCAPLFREVMGSCQCFSPYYLTPQGTCQCMDSMLPAIFYSNSNDSDLRQCQKCPSGCQCNIYGCVKCDPSALRVVTHVILASRDFYTCNLCVDYAFQSNGTCLCVDGNQPTSQGTCICQTSIFFYQWIPQSQCQICPQRCLCSEQKGCYSCQIVTLRNVTFDSSVNKYHCPCVNGATVGDEEASCYCEKFVDPNNSSQCLCPDPYYMNNIGQCACKSDSQPGLFYKDLATDDCYICPEGCVCDELGCNQCDPDALRYVYTKNDHYQCPCLQIAGLVNSSCTVCPENFHYFSGECLACWQCKSCDWIGQCTSCNSDMDLVNSTCVCQQGYYININGTCRCPLGYYFNYTNSECDTCPVFCMDCGLSSSSTIVNCLACATSMHRQNKPSSNCPCEDGYIEFHSGKKPYCCDKHCNSCNETGCTSCMVDMYRQLNNQQQCVCISNLIDINSSLVCNCPPHQYRYMEFCETCPVNCKLCVYNQRKGQAVCLSCPDNSNRNNTPGSTNIIKCFCQPKFVEATPMLLYCYPKHCAQAEPYCTVCLDNRVPASNGTVCVCKDTYFEDSNDDCKSCKMAGCVMCSSTDSCYLCNQTDNYFLTGSTCKKKLDEQNYIYIQSAASIIIQFLNDSNTSQYPLFTTANGSLNQIRDSLSPQAPIIKAVNLTTLYQHFTKQNIITARFTHPLLQINDSMLAVNYVFEKRLNSIGGTWYGTDSQGVFTAVDGWIYLKLGRVYSKHKMQFGKHWQAKTELFLTVLALIICLCLYIKGFKHNQTIFFLQTLAFLSFTIEDQRFEKTVFLYNLRFSYLDFGNILEKAIPNNYLQTSFGNFSFFTIDSNLYRVAGTTLIIAAVTSALILLFRFGYHICISTRIKNNKQAFEIVRSHKKHVYRCLEFFHKTCMYPLIFFSFVTIKNWHARILVDNKKFLHVSHGLAIGICVAYLFYTIYQIWWETTAKIHKIENASEFLCDCLASLIICCTVYKKSYLLLLVVYAFRCGVYLIKRQVILREFRNIEYIKIFSTLLEIIAISLTLTNLTSVIITITISAVITHIIHATSIVFLTDEKAYFDKRKMDESIQYTQSSENMRIDDTTYK